MNHTQPLHTAAAYTVAGIDIHASSLVVQRRDLHPDATIDQVSRFGDPRWNIFVIMPDRHSSNQTIHWDEYPTAFQYASKLYVFALINAGEDAPRLPGSSSRLLATNSILREVPLLRLFLRWLDQRGITRLDQVTVADLDEYLRHVLDLPHGSAEWKSTALKAVQRLHLYRSLLPAHCRLPEGPLWNGAVAAQLANVPDRKGLENLTPRIHPDVMEPLLSAAILTVDAIALDLVPVARRLLDLRQLADKVASSERFDATGSTMSRMAITKAQLEKFLTAVQAHGLALPGIPDQGSTVIDFEGLAAAGWLSANHLARSQPLQRLIHASGLPLHPDLLRPTTFTEINSRPWRNDPVSVIELRELVWHLRTACFLVIAYLSGMRTGEVLNLRHDCITHDHKLGLIFLSGQQVKAPPHRRERSPATIPWVVTTQVAQAVSVLEDLSFGPFLFPSGRFCSHEWLTTTRACTGGRINEGIRSFTTWFNTHIAPRIQHPVIPDDEHGRLAAPRLRRTLAWHIVRRPGGTVAAATQYGHLHTQITHGYAGNASSGFGDAITFEEFLARAEQLHHDHERLTSGEHVSGPAADTYRNRVDAAQRFAGLTITSKRHVDKALSNPDLQIHHGELLTCVYRPETAKCRSLDDTNVGPSWPRCQPTCVNIAYTDRDITRVRSHANSIRTDLDQLGLPQPLRQRLQNRLDHDNAVIAQHDNTRDQLESNP